MKTPITYYGGKQRLASRIVKLIPEHRLYVEPFFGGGAVFFQKHRPEINNYVEVINDTNSEVVNFYTILRDAYPRLHALVAQTQSSRVAYRKAGIIYDNTECFDPIERAWAFWVQTNMSFSCKIKGGFGYDLKGGCVKKIWNKKTGFEMALNERLRGVEIEHSDALQVINSRDTRETFFYLDPPYPNSDQGHYKGYYMSDFMMLLDRLSGIKGRFLLSSYDYPELTKASKANSWHQVKIEQTLSASKPVASKRKRKIEVLTANYELN